jgi:hypothetical protein
LDLSEFLFFLWLGGYIEWLDPVELCVFLDPGDYILLLSIALILDDFLIGAALLSPENSRESLDLQLLNLIESAVHLGNHYVRVALQGPRRCLIARFHGLAVPTPRRVDHDQELLFAAQDHLLECVADYFAGELALGGGVVLLGFEVAGEGACPEALDELGDAGLGDRPAEQVLDIFL